MHTFFFQEDTTLGNHDGYVSVDVALAVLIYERYGNIGICDALAQWHAEYAMWPGFRYLGSKSRVSRVSQNEEWCVMNQLQRAPRPPRCRLVSSQLCAGRRALPGTSCGRAWV